MCVCVCECGCTRAHACMFLYAAFVRSCMMKPSDFIIYKWIGREKTRACVCVRVCGCECRKKWRKILMWNTLKKKNECHFAFVCCRTIIWIECIARCVIFTPIQTPNLNKHTHTHTDTQCSVWVQKIMCKNVTRFVTVSSSTMQWANLKLMQIWMWFDSMLWVFLSLHSISFSAPPFLFHSLSNYFTIPHSLSFLHNKRRLHTVCYYGNKI